MRTPSENQFLIYLGKLCILRDKIRDRQTSDINELDMYTLAINGLREYVECRLSYSEEVYQWAIGEMERLDNLAEDEIRLFAKHCIECEGTLIR